MNRQARDPSDEILIGISSCLLGNPVRFDGGHKHDAYLTQTVGRFVRFVSVCPEVDIGLGTPRETIRLEQTTGELRLVAPKSGRDHTTPMRRYSKQKVRELRGLGLSGYILKKGSPSCGMERVRVYGKGGVPSRSGRGFFAQALFEAMPWLPVEEEGRLQDPRLRENFFERVFAYRRLEALFARTWKPVDLVRFHTTEKLLLLAHDPAGYRSLGRLVAQVGKRPRKDMASDYRQGFLHALHRLATTRKHTNVLQHILGYLKKQAGLEDRQELAGLIEDFRQGLVPLVVPVTLVRHLVRVHDLTYLACQTYLEPHPRELMLRNHA